MWSSNDDEYQKAVELWTSEEDSELALEHMRKIGDLRSLKTLAVWYFSLGSYQEEAIECWKEAAETFLDLESISTLALYYSSTSDFDLVIQYWELGALQKDPVSIVNLAHYFQSKHSSIGCPDEDEPLFIYTQMATKFEDSQSLRCLAEWTLESESKAKLDLYLKAAKAGDVSSYVIAASILYQGLYIPRNIPYALELFICAARLAAQPSLHDIALYYQHGEEGCFVPDIEKSFSLHEEAARDGSVESRKHLADSLWNGIGCEMDKEMAKSLYESAVDSGSTSALPGLIKCCIQMNPVDRPKARNLMRSFILKSVDGLVEDGALSDKSIDLILDDLNSS